MYNITLLNKISSVGLSHFNEQYIINDNIDAADGILVRSQDMLEMSFSDRLKAIARAGAGVNNIPLDRCAENGIVVFNTPGANANAVKELVLLGLLLSARNVSKAMEWVRTLDEDVAKQVEKGKSQFAGHELLGKKLGVIGLGAIGRKVAEACKALGMDVLGYDPFVSELEGFKVYADMYEMLPECDFVTLHLPANDKTKGMVDAKFFAAMKDDAILLNFSRDKLVKDIDLCEALSSKKLAQYVTDFPTDAVMGFVNTTLLPHLGASTEEAEDNCAVMAVKEMTDYLENGNIVNSVNFPALDMGKKNGTRLCFIVKDMADPLSEILSVLSDSDIIAKQIKAVRREDGISYVLCEIEDAEKKLLIKGELGAKVLMYRSI